MAEKKGLPAQDQPGTIDDQGSLDNTRQNDLREIVNAKLARFANHEEESIPQWIYDSLPSLLRESCNVFNDRHEKDVFLTGTLAVLGGCFHNLHAYNEPDKKEVTANLLAIIVAPPASGKGALNYSRKMAKGIKEAFAKSHRSPFKKGERLFIPANISSAGMIKLLSKNKGIGVMVESEIDTIVNANKQEWGNYSEIIRKSFENEEYNMYRKGKEHSEYYEIEKLQLSLAISGTPSQFRQLILSADNGLFSRGTYYVFHPSQDEKLQFTGRMNSDIVLDDKFARFAKIAADYYETHLAFEKVQVGFNKDQLDLIGATLQFLKDELAPPADFGANIKRAFVMAQKIATILTFLSECESGSLQELVSCPDTVLDTTVKLIAYYVTHASKAYELLPSQSQQSFNDSQQRLLQVLPEEFTRTEAVQLGMEIGLSQRAAYYAIQALEDKGVIKLSKEGKYKK